MTTGMPPEEWDSHVDLILDLLDTCTTRDQRARFLSDEINRHALGAYELGRWREAQRCDCGCSPLSGTPKPGEVEIAPPAKVRHLRSL